ncbi:uncharacterized protein PFL1_03040 [Pseudozyma flocculosa PF-1]|uniref:RFX-type winged-helix domain-containing protein n=1 Tax=Pseudozyma flocculosa PF-1 TaxID=1277687 RepID=A0A061HB76_9BASI|nr:uncharacterized protein PFL1_03040 [Pseudozyma flocculosa PF-1]EPQ29285.1 hypothetical protein PFL1_03040 [Pseudozyma flocculosa PF-1]
MSQQPPYQGPPNPNSRAAGQPYDYSQPPRPSSQTLEDSRMDFGSYASSSSGSDFRYASSHHRPDALPSLQPPSTGSSQMSLLFGSNATTPRQSAFTREQIDRPPQLSLAMSQYGSASGAANQTSSSSSAMPMRMSYFDGGVGTMASGDMSGGASFSDPSRSMQLPAASSSSLATSSTAAAWQQSSLHRTSYNSLGSSSQSGYASSDAGGMMLPSSTAFAYDSSSENNSPIRPPGYYDASSAAGHVSYAGPHSYASAYGSKGLEQAYGGGHPSEVSITDIDNALSQISTLYKSATTKKNAEFYRDKWARIWLSCNYTLKASIQISIPRTILHESYRRACESFGVEPLQAASFGKVLRGQFPDVAQRRLGGRGKTRFHYCGFGTSNQREAIKVKQLLDDEKAGRLQLSVGMSAEFAQQHEGRTRSITSGGEDLSRSYASLDPSGDGRHLHFANAAGHYGGQSTSGSLESQDDKVAASAFATLNASASGAQAGTAASHMPRRHTLSSSDANRVMFGGSLPSLGAGAGSTVGTSADGSFEAAKGELAASGVAASSSSVGGGLLHHHGRLDRAGGGDSSGLPSVNNSPSLSMSGRLSRPQSVAHFRRSCRDLPDWPNPDEGDSTLNAASFHLSMKGKIAWKEYESMCQDLLHSIYQGPDMAAFDRRATAFWSALSQDSQEAMRTEPTLCELILRGDAIIVRQLLVRLDDMIGDDVSDERTASLSGTAMSMSSRLQNLLEGRLPASFVKSKVQACEKLTENLERVARIFESIKQFRENSMLDLTSGRRYPDSHPLGPPSFPSTSSSHADILGPHQAPYGGPPSKASFNFQGGARRRDDSIGSSVSDSHYTWLSGDHQYSSSASESDFSLHSAPTADTGHGGNSGVFGSMAAPVARKWSGHRMRMSSGPLSRSTGTSEASSSAAAAPSSSSAATATATGGAASASASAASSEQDKGQDQPMDQL